MKVLQVAPVFPPAYAYGGPPRSVYNLSKALVDRGHDVTVLTTDAKDDTERVRNYENPENFDGIETLRYRNLSNRLAWQNIHLTPMLWARTHQLVSEYDVVHTHGFRLLQTWNAHLATRRVETPHIHQPRGSVPRADGSRQKQLFDKLFGKRVLAEAECVIASSESEASQFSSVHPVGNKQIETVPNGIDLDKFDLLPDEGAFREEYGIGSDVPIVLFLSRLHERKGGGLLVSAFADVRDSYPDAKLVFVGPDEGAREALEQQVDDYGLSDDVLFTGPLYDEAKLAAYRDADVFVLPSTDRHESFGNVVLEALACGTSVVVTRVCGVAEYLPGRFSITAEPSESSLAAGIRDLLTGLNPDRNETLSFLKSEFSWAAVADRTESIYWKLLETEDEA
ncbi:glycosyltransferase [Halorubrum sp. GN11GM_10-3_MGM]|uniref:glycosyltransferase n=1 Tax=Halorubrum sp. GN11GM_10-3_MGM TaxID=2518111 RepID=UPI0010F75AC8|nr:glycosyltransferase [Halorubrum sp. GN11GM_10-3_MGM]TKX67640.1 glycosyltransferase [Halorubrum sp. GN11GM_10-3_MGM]